MKLIIASLLAVIILFALCQYWFAKANENKNDILYVDHGWKKFWNYDSRPHREPHAPHIQFVPRHSFSK